MANIPAWLDSPPDGNFPSPPIETCAQSLPYHELSWENFERLILRLVRREPKVSDCRLYGERGQNQHGLDILAELHSDKFACYQCKRVEKFSADDIKKAVSTFLQGKWVNKTEKFVLCTTLKLQGTQQVDAITEQRNILKAKGIKFETWDGSMSGLMSERLKKYPDLVDDFFSREWVCRFNGEDAAESLGERLDGVQLLELRTQLNTVYATLFHRFDQGIRIGNQPTVKLLDRYIPPAVVETRETVRIETAPEQNSQKHGETFYLDDRQQPYQSRLTRISSTQDIQIAVGDWFSRHSRSVILGEPGYGKSALLRVAAMQLLSGSDSPFYLPWHGFLPVWVSFGGFSAAIQRQPSINLEDYFDQWLHQNSVDSIRALFKRSLRHGKIVLLVDGLDEGPDIEAVKQAMDRLSAFLALRAIPVVFTSRPRGYERVRPDGSWPVTRLAAFDESQVERFAKTWFVHFESPESGTDKQLDWAESSADQRTSDFMKAIRANPRVLELARTPLFCQLLIDIFRFDHDLPEHGVEVYKKIVELLLKDHPAARGQAAGLATPTPTNIPRSDDMREMLMRLALHIQENGGSGVISIDDSQAVFRGFLIDDIDGPGLSNYDAKDKAKAVIDYAQIGLGLVVERAPNELGFFHLTVQEYLSALAMVRKDENEQLDWLSRVWDQPRWHEVVIAWFSIRGTEQGKNTTQRAIDHIKQCAKGEWARLQLLRLRTELASGELGLSPREARATIEEAADEIETTPFPELGQELARHITLGLRSPSVANQCESRLAKWLPARSDWDRAGLLQAFGNWSMADDLLNTLKLALHDESIRCRWAAAETLAKVYASDHEVGEYLASKAVNWPDVGVRAAALHGLGKGWPHHGALLGLAEAARKSTDMNLALTGIAIRVNNQLHDEKDRERIWFMFTHNSVSYEMRDFCREVLVQGWCKDEELKNLAMDSLRNRLYGERRVDEEQAVCFLAESWPGDEEVATVIANLYINTSPRFLMHDHEKWKILFNTFKGNIKLSDALRGLLSEFKSKYKENYWKPHSKWAYCIIHDDAAKTELLEAYSANNAGNNKYWILSTLMEAWSDDKEVRDTLAKEFDRPPGEVAYIASWIDSFVTEPSKRRQWLLEAVETSDMRNLVIPVRRLLKEFQDLQCLAAAKAALEKDIWFYDKIDIQGQLIINFPHVQASRCFAEQSFEELDGVPLSSVAIGYQHDASIRVCLLKLAVPAKVNIRLEIYRVLREYTIPKYVGLALTEHIWVENNEEIRTAGVVARCMYSSPCSDIKETLIAKLKEEAVATGSDHQIRRCAAFAGLMQLGLFTVCIDLLEKSGNQSINPPVHYRNSNSIMANLLFKHLEDLQNAAESLQQSFELPWDVLIFNGEVQEAFSNSYARTQLIDHLKSTEIDKMDMRKLNLMAELMPNSVELYTHLITRMNRQYPDNNLWESIYEISKILAEHFSDNEQVRIELEKILFEQPEPTQIHSPLLYALALGWPDSPLLQRYLGQSDIKGWPLIFVFAICGINGNEEHAMACLDRLAQITLEQGGLHNILSWSLRNWGLKAHAEALLRRFLDNSSPTAIRLLGLAGKLNSDERKNLVEQFDKIVRDSSTSCPDGVDLVSGSVTTLPQAIFRTLTQ